MTARHSARSTPLRLRLPAAGRAAPTPARDDLLVGGTLRPGGVTFENDWAVVRYGTSVLFADGFESGDTSAWSSGRG